MCCLPSKVDGRTIQSIATAIGNLLCLNFGLMYGITLSHSGLYQSSATPLTDVTDARGASWLTGHLFLCAALSAAVAGWLSRKIGSKSVLLLCGILQIFAWFCIHFAYALIHIYASRMFAGVAAGAALVVLPQYINDITEHKEKSARLAFTIDVWRTLGMLVGAAIGYYLPYDYVSIVGCAVSFIFTMSFPFVQESPWYYLRKGNVASMEKSLRWFRGIRDIDDRTKPEFKQEVEIFKQKMQNSHNISINPMTRVYITRLWLITLLLVVGAQLSGVFVVLNYAQDLLGDAKIGALNVEQALLVLLGAHFLGTLIARLLGSRMPHKLLLCLSTLSSALSLIALALYRNDIWHLNSALDSYVPLVLLSLHLLAVGSGLQPLATVVPMDVLPPKLYSTIFALASAMAWLFVLGLIESFDELIESFVPITYYIWFFAGACICTLLLSVFVLPETRGRRSTLVQQQLGYVGNGDVAKCTEITNGNISHI